MAAASYQALINPPTSNHIRPVVKTRDVWFDRSLSFERHIMKLVLVFSSENRNTLKVVTFKNTETILQAFILSSLENGGSLFTCQNQNLIIGSRLYRTFNQKRETGSRYSCSCLFNCLPVFVRISTKILLITLKALHDLAHSSISDLLTPCVHTLRSKSGVCSLWVCDLF